MEITQPVAMWLSIVIEAIAGWLFLRMCGWADPMRGAAAAALGTLCTHPAVWYAVENYDDVAGFWTVAAAAETFAVVAETLPWRFIPSLPWRRALISSLVTNMASFASGFLIEFLWPA